MIEGILIGLRTVIMPTNLFLVVIGCFAGSVIGMLPGLGPISAIALLIPITYNYEPASALILLAGIYYGAVFGGSTSSILINAPGISGTVATSFDGYPLAQKGHPGKALAVAAYSSFSGGTIAAVFLLIAAPALAKVSLSFQSADYFALMILGMTAVSAFAGKGSFLKAALMTIFGIMLSTIGTDLTAGVQRFTFGLMDLSDGLSFVLLAMATFALSEALMSTLKREDVSEKIREAIKGKMSSLKLSRKEVKEIAPTIGRSSVLGFIIGVLPGAGATIASFLTYGVERNIAKGKDRLEFGKGSLKGLAAPETANNAASSGSFVPLLTLGIPGSGTTAIILGALLSYGIQPGPRLFVDHPSIFWSVIVSMYIGNVVLLIINLPLIPYIAKILALPKKLLVPYILFFSLIGVYFVSFNTFDIVMMVFIASLAVALRLLSFPMPPMLLGFILGGMMEDNLRRALAINRGSLSFLWERPITLTILIITLLFLLKPLIETLKSSGFKIKSDG
ncbi:MAG: tripartite tricarboxylate transporter permease [Spirochaetota bacterium]|nr:tripartite tricarboxylate transporter permease [Spirochaetota bacterium]